MLPRTRDLPVHQEAGERVGGLGVEQHGSEPFRQDLRPARVYEQRGIPRREEPDGRRGVGGWERRSRKIEQLSAVLVAEPSQRHPLERGRERRHGDPGPARDVLARCGTESAEVATDEQFEPFVACRVGRARQPVLRHGIQVGRAPLPCARRRNAQEVEPPTDAVPHRRGHAELRDEVLPPAWTIGQQGTRTARDGRHLTLGDLVSGRAQPPRAAVLSDARCERPVVARRDHVDRAAHQRALDDGSPLQRLRQLRAFEAFEPRPQPDVGGRRVLRLHPAHPLDRPRERRARALQQHLPSQQGAVRSAFGQRPLGHRRSLRAGDDHFVRR